jgi:hypothetical protein
MERVQLEREETNANKESGGLTHLSLMRCSPLEVAASTAAAARDTRARQKATGTAGIEDAAATCRKCAPYFESAGSACGQKMCSWLAHARRGWRMRLQFYCRKGAVKCLRNLYERVLKIQLIFGTIFKLRRNH